MRKIIIKRKRKKNSLHGWLLWFALTAAFSLIGLSLGTWQGGMSLQGNVATAHLEVFFSGIDEFSTEDNTSGSFVDWVEREGGAEDHSVNIKIPAYDNKIIIIDVTNAYQGDVIQLKYYVQNNGHIPVKVELEAVDVDGLLINHIRAVPQLCPGPENIDYGIIRFNVTENAGTNQQIDFNVQLLFKQWNLKQ